MFCILSLCLFIDYLFDLVELSFGLAVSEVSIRVVFCVLGML